MSEGTGGWGSWSDVDARLAADPGTSGEDLARIAAARPDLRAALAANPASYPALLDWLRLLHDPMVDRALEARSSLGTVGGVPNPASTAPNPAYPAYTAANPAYTAPNPAYVTSAPAQAPGLAGPGEPATSWSWQGYDPGTTGGSVPVLLGPEPSRRRRGRVWVGVGVAVALVLGLGGAGYAFVGAKLAGSATPEAAVAKLLAGVAKKDPLGLAGAISPAEFSPFQSVYGDLTDRTATGDPTVQAAVRKALDSLTITVDGLQTQSSGLDDGLAKVTIVGGTVTVDGDPAVIADAIATATGSSAQGLLAMDSAGLRSQLSDELSGKLPYTVNLADDLAFQGGAPFLVTVQEKGKWYVSPLMTLGEYLAQSQGIRRGAMPTAADLVKPKDPVDAAQQFAQALEKVPGGDLGPLAATLPLAERRFVDVYGQAFVDEAMKKDPQGGGTLTLTSMDFQVVSQGAASAQVAPTDLAFGVTDSSGATQTISTDSRCLSVESSDASIHTCLADLPLLGTLGLDQMRLTTVKEDGGWYVSIFGTVGTWSTTIEKNLAQLAKDGKLADQTWWQSQLPAGTTCAVTGSC